MPAVLKLSWRMGIPNIPTTELYPPPYIRPRPLFIPHRVMDGRMALVLERMGIPYIMYIHLPVLKPLAGEWESPTYILASHPLMSPDVVQ